MKVAFKFFVLLALLIACVNVFSVKADDSGTKNRVLRVAYPKQDGLTMLDENGDYYGYTYDYLMEIAKYTGWTYDFVQMEGDSNEQAVSSLNMLQSGEIDLMGGLVYDESLAKIYSYPGYCYGINYAGIFVPSDSDLTSAALYTTKNIRVGVFRKDLSKNEKLDQFAEMNNIDIEQVLVDSTGKLKDMAETGEVDAIFSTDLALLEHEGMHAIAHFSPTPFYFATKKGNVDIVRQLDYAISTIDQVNPNFSSKLYNHYFSNDSSEFRLSEEEQAFIANTGIQEVVIYDNKPPFCFVDEETGELSGITIEIFERFSEMTGLEFHFNTVSSYQEYISFIKSKKADISADTLLNNQDALDTNSTLTLPWHSFPIYMVFKEGTNSQKDGTYAIPYFLKNAIDPPQNVTYYDTAKQCMDAVQEGKVDYAFVGEFCVQYFLNSGAYNDLKLLNQQDSLTQKLSFGVVNTGDFYLLSVINKCITFLPEDQLGEIVYRNTYQQQIISFSQWVKNNSALLIPLVMVLIILLLSYYIYIKHKGQQRVEFENKRYDTLSNLSNEFFYEYDIYKDELFLPDKCAKYFLCDTKIEHFSTKVSDILESDRSGIWCLGSSIIENKEGSIEISCQMPDQTRQWFKLVSDVVSNRKQKVYAIGKIVNIQDIKTEQIRLEQKAFTDGLTGIYNIATIKAMVQKRLELFTLCSPYAFIILDIDNFKQINDKFGHYSGDAVLIQVAKLMSDIFYPNMMGRLGGDEFVIFVEKTSIEELERQCNNLCRYASEKINDMIGQTATLSIGISFTSENRTYETLYKEADYALYQRKAGLKNGFTFYQN